MIPVDSDKLCMYNVVSRATTEKALQRNTLKNTMIIQSGILKFVHGTHSKLGKK